MDESSFPLFDAHTHYSLAYLTQVLRLFDDQKFVGCVNMWGATTGMSLFYTHYEEFLLTMRGLNRESYGQVYWPDWTEMGWRATTFVERLVKDMRKFDTLGCCGLKVWKDLGMFILDENNVPVTMDDPRLEPVWDTAAELNWTIAVHQADPARNWPSPRIRTNLSREEIFQRRDVVLQKHTDIRWVLCHNGNDAGNVRAISALLDRFPHVMTDINRPQEEIDSIDDVRPFFEKYADRIIWSTDMIYPVERPPDVPWTVNNVYGPWRKKLVSYNLSPATFRKFTLDNARRVYLERR